MHPSRCLGTPSNSMCVVWDFGIPYLVMTGVRPINHIQLPLLARVCLTIARDVNRKYFSPLERFCILHSRSGKRCFLLALCLILEVGFVCAWQGLVLARYLIIAVVSKPLHLLRLYDTKDLFDGILLGEYWDRSTQLCTISQFEGMKRINRSLSNIKQK